MKMKMNTIPTESEMLRKVRRWRRQAYETDQVRPQPQNADRLGELAERFGLRTTESQRGTSGV